MTAAPALPVSEGSARPSDILGFFLRPLPPPSWFVPLSVFLNLLEQLFLAEIESCFPLPPPSPPSGDLLHFVFSFCVRCDRTPIYTVPQLMVRPRITSSSSIGVLFLSRISPPSLRLPLLSVHEKPVLFAKIFSYQVGVFPAQVFSDLLDVPPSLTFPSKLLQDFHISRRATSMVLDFPLPTSSSLTMEKKVVPLP